MAVRQAAQMPPAEQAAIRRKAAELRADLEGL
jgi:hypothetical protein